MQVLVKASKLSCASIPALDPVDSDPLWAYSLSPQATDGLIQQDIDLPDELSPFSGTCVFPVASGSQVGGDRDIPVPHGITGYVPCALAGYNARCSFTVVIRQKIRPRTLASPASHCYWLVIGDLIPLLTVMSVLHMRSADGSWESRKYRM